MNLNKNTTSKLKKENIIIIAIFGLGYIASGIMTFTFGNCSNTCIIGEYISVVVALPITLTEMLKFPVTIVSFWLLPVYWYLMSLLLVSIFKKIKK